MFILMEKTDARFFRSTSLFAHTRHDFVAPLRPVRFGCSLGGVVAEDADIRCPKHLAQFDGALKTLQVRFERLVNAHLAYRRANSAKLETVLIEQGLELADLQVRKREDISFMN